MCYPAEYWLKRMEELEKQSKSEMRFIDYPRVWAHLYGEFEDAHRESVGEWQCTDCGEWFDQKVRPYHYDKGLLSTVRLCYPCFEEMESSDSEVDNDN